MDFSVLCDATNHILKFIVLTVTEKLHSSTIFEPIKGCLT